MSLRDQLDPDFLQEMDELLQQLESSVLIVERNAEDKNAINQLFRVMHSIKGSAGMYSLDAITNFTHHLESNLDSIRKNGGAVQRSLIDAILCSHDLIPRMLDGESCSREVEEALAALHGRVTVAAGHTDLPVLLPKASGSEFFDDGDAKKQHTYTIEFLGTDSLFEGSGPEPLFNEIRDAGDVQINIRLDKLPSPLDESYDPLTCYLAWNIIITTTLTEDDLADMFIFYVGKAENLTITELTEAEVQPENRLGDILIERGVVSPEQLNQALDHQKTLGEILVATGAASQSDVSSALTEQVQRRAKSGPSDVNSTIRVDAIKLDRLVDLVGEMVTAQARLHSLALMSDNPEMQEVAEIVEALTVGLRDQTMSIRMVPLATILGGFNRLVRDLSRDLGKEMLFETEGEDTELDKSVVERLKEPLIHIIRNSADHGIESREKRLAAGKPAAGTITIKAYHEGAQVVIAIHDDGGGLNLDVIRKRAIERGLISPETVLSPAETAQLICYPGFSTAEVVSDISGRGVGMDVVKQSIEALRGTLVIDTVPGTSTTMLLRLPITLAIIDGLMVSMDDDSFIIPLSMVEECVDLNHDVVNNIKGRDIINLRGEAVPFVRLRQRLNKTSTTPDREQVVITIQDGRRTGVVVDAVIGSHQTVLKPLGAAFRKARYFSGATILGDGSVALILDVPALIM